MKRNSNILLPLQLAFFVVGSLGTFVAASLPEIRQDFSISTSIASLLYVAWGLGIVIGSLTSNYFISLYKLRQILVSAGFAGLLAAYTGSDTQSFVVFLLCYFMLGISSGTILTMGHGYVGRKSNKSRASNISILDLSLSLGAVSAPMLLSYFITDNQNLTQWRDSFSVYKTLLILFIGLILFSDLEDYPESKLKVSIYSIVTVFKNPVFICFSIVSLLYHAFEYGHTYWFVTYSTSLSTDINSDAARNILVGFLSGAIVSRMALTLVATNSIMPFVLAISTAIALSIVSYMPNHDNFLSLYIANILFGASVGVIFPSMLAVAISTSDRLGAAFSSSALIFGAIGTQTSAVLLGVIIEHGHIQKIYPILSVIGFILLVSVIILIKRSLASTEVKHQTKNK